MDRYLADRCPSPAIELCVYQGEMLQTADDWLWALDSPIYKLGGLEPFEPEARRIVFESLALYPAMHLKAAIVSAVQTVRSNCNGRWADALELVYAVDLRGVPAQCPEQLYSR